MHWEDLEGRALKRRRDETWENYGENLVRRCVEKKRFEKVACRQRGDEDSTAALTKGVAGCWQNVFTACDRHSYKQIAGDLLVEVGYERTENGSYRRRGHTPAGGNPRAVCAALEHCSDFRTYRVLAEYLSVRLFHLRSIDQAIVSLRVL